ncbi:MAG TPA: Gfo/Idh/MocA family oxidoreductase [Alphaproteobacteria bacterium]
MIRLGIVGCNYGRAVHLPAFRLDPRCQVIALAGTDRARTAELARQSEIPEAFGDWSELVARADIDAVAIATPPRLQSEIAIAALSRGKPVFIEKPMATDLDGAAAMLRAAGVLPTMMDFNFTEIAAWKQAKQMLDAGAIGRLRHVAVNWNVENPSTRLRLKNWKTSGADGGGALGNFASHSLHYFEWLCGPIAGLSARLSGLPDDPSIETNVVLGLAFRSGAAGSFALSCASFLGSGHRLEFYGEDGTLVLANPTADYMRGFGLSYARRPAEALAPVAVADDPLDRQFPAEGRIAPVSRLARRFLDAVERRQPTAPGFAEGYRVQMLLDAVRRSHALGRWVEIEDGARA